MASIRSTFDRPTRLEEIMNPRVVTIRADDPASDAWTRMRRRGIRHLVVLDAGEIAGVISERDLGGRDGGRLRRGRKVHQLMTPRVVSATPATSLDDAADMMRGQLIGCLPVMRDGDLVGIVTATDVFDALALASTGVDATPPTHAPTAPRGRVEKALLRAPTSSRRLGGAPVPPQRAQEGVDVRTRQTPAKREPLAAEVPRPKKMSLGRTSTEHRPANIRASGVALGDDEREYMRRKLGRKLGKYASAMERVTVRVRDVNGPRGGVDIACRIKVVLSGLPSAVFEAQGASAGAAFDSALAGIERVVRRSIRQRRTPAPRGSRGTAGA
jgi:CBS domain-containing protein/ribosome-associated translation inhibitor RaiA